MKSYKLYLKPVGGLCNRMRAVDTAVLLAKQLNKQLIVFWGRDVFLNCRFSDLFRPSAHYKVIEEKQWMGKKAIYPYLPGSKPTSLAREAFYNLTKKAFRIKTEIWFEDFENAIAPLNAAVNPASIKSMREFEEKSLFYINPLLEPLQRPGSSFICTAWRLNNSVNYSKNFAPVKSLDEKIHKITSGFNNTIGVHIRRTDHLPSIAYSKLGNFIEAMDQELLQDNSTMFFIATDCKETERQLTQRYSDKIITHPKSSYNRNTTMGIQDAVVDLFCLSKTQKVLGSYYSSFSQIATEISGIKEVTVY